MAVSPVPMYTNFLNSIGCTVDAEDKISFVMPDGSSLPVTLEGKRLVMPTPEMLRKMDANLHVGYHPMAEQVTRNESPVQKKLRGIINIKATYILGSIMQDLTALAISDKKERTSKSEYFDLFTVMKDATPKTLQSVQAVVNTLEVAGVNKRLINFTSRRGGKLDGKPFRRITQISFPILEEFSDKAPADHIFDVKVSKKDKIVIFELLKYIISKLQTPDAYSAGSDSMDAPMFISVALAWSNLMEDLNQISWRYKDVIANITYCNTEITYLDQLQKISTYVGFIPSLEGNEGLTQLTNRTTGVVVADVGSLSPANPTSVMSTPMNAGIVAPTAPLVAPVVTGMGDSPLRSPGVPLGGGIVSAPPVMTNAWGIQPSNGWGQSMGQGWGAPAQTYLPPGTVMGTNGKPVNVLTSTLDELEKVLDPATYSTVYNQRMNQAAMAMSMQGMQTGFNMGMQAGFGMGQQGGFGTGWPT